MKYALICFIVACIVLPQFAGAQFQQEFTIEAEIFSETTGENHSGGSSSGTRIDRNDSATTPYIVPNVRNVAVSEQGGGIAVTWTNPAVDFASVRVIKDDFYATDPYDGWVIYNSRGESFTDAQPDLDGVFYTLFVVLPDGRTSSGVTIFYKAGVVVPTGYPHTMPTEISDTATTSDPEAATMQTDAWWSRFPLIGTQASRALQPVGTFFVGQFSASEDIVFSIPARILPPGVETVVLIIENKQTTTYERFTMRRDGTALVAAVPRRLYAGEYVVGIVLYDFENKEQGQHFRTIDIYPHYFVSEETTPGRVLVTDYIVVVYALCGLFALFALWRVLMVIKRR